jgi:hypothetical protein
MNKLFTLALTFALTSAPMLLTIISVLAADGE